MAMGHYGMLGLAMRPICARSKYYLRPGFRALGFELKLGQDSNTSVPGEQFLGAEFGGLAAVYGIGFSA